MGNSALDTDVLIVGAGPVGLFLANECARRGLRWRLVETRSTQSEHSKALAIFPRTLEIFDMAGLVGRSSRRPTASRPSLWSPTGAGSLTCGLRPRRARIRSSPWSRRT